MKEVSIHVTVAPDGETKVEAFGFANNACLKETKSVEEALGKVEARQLKPEGHITEGTVGSGTKVGV
jgi:hypothetical protein